MIGVLVGVAMVLAGVALRGKGPETGATGSGAAPSGVAASASPGSSAVAASSEPGTPVPLVLSGAKASSSVGNRPKFAASMAIDGDLATSWQEGSQQEKDQWIEVSFDPSRADTLVIRNGYQASQAAYPRQPAA